ncbi:hypothetical protein BIV57_21380 [Mangrovactinospora gilvigrisea]|uniref:Sugar ABC transporter substrate-binding protein n=1 Tax=Mangrovactinospora gilvigrisea TaxID=1428644 RepID=A0A1J7BA35_9ACTN|nr:sugar ABC transporter substrate-binding protein [Mangrovactinospora gilvigrisea]OIV35470.1 hypothetical protein BIV57_21380 [Mangrovactinospora gilvigrisea]
MPIPRRRTVLGAAAAALAAPALAACGGEGAGGGSKTLRYTLWDQNQYPAMIKAAKEFESQNPGVHISLELVPYGQYWTKLQTAAIGGTAPDVAWMSTLTFQLFAAYDQLLPLSTAANAASIGAANYPPALVEAYAWKGQQYGLPKDYDTIGLWYNKQLFDKAGVRYPDATWTWSDLRDAARKLTDKKAGVHGFAAEMSNQSCYYDFIYQNDGFVISPDRKRSGYDNPRTVEAITFLIDMIKDGSSPSMAEIVDSGSASLFQSGKLAMTYQGSWMTPQFAAVPLLKKYGDVTVMAKGRKRATITNGLGNCVFRTTRNPELAKKFALFMSGKRTGEIQAEAGVVIPGYRGTEKAWLATNKQWQLQSFIDEVPYAVPFPHSINSTAWQDDEQTYLPQAWAGYDDIGDATRKLADAMNLDLRREARTA